MHFILDQNFPWHITNIPWPIPIRVTPLWSHNPDLTRGFEDWQVIQQLGLAPDVDGFITNDAKMLSLPTEMVALSSTRLTLVVTDGVGHNPLRATGLVMVYLHEVSRRADGSPQIYVFRPTALGTQKPGEFINKIAKRRGLLPYEMISSERRAMASHG